MDSNACKNRDKNVTEKCHQTRFYEGARLQRKSKGENAFFLYNSPKGQFSVKRLVIIGQKPKYRCYSKFSALNAL